MKKIISAVLGAVLAVSCLNVSAFAIDKNSANSELAAQVKAFSEETKSLFDADGDGKLSATDARATLRCSAGLENQIKNNRAADIDGDDIVSAIDARILLRLAAGLDSTDKYYSNDLKLNYFNSIINSVKPNNYTYIRDSSSKTDDITYDNDKLVKDFTKQVRALEGFSGGTDFDFGAELTSDKGKTSYTGTYIGDVNTGYSGIKSSMPISGNDLASLLTVNNIDRIVYSQNESFRFARHTSDGTKETFYSNTLTGLDSITVYVKADSPLKAAPTNPTSLNNGKIFDLISQSTIDEINAADGSFGDLSNMEGMDEFGTFKVGAGFTNVRYYGSFVKIYFNKNTGIPVAAQFSQHYDISSKLSMDIDLSLGLISLLKVKGDINLKNVMTDVDTFCFRSADPENIITLTKVG